MIFRRIFRVVILFSMRLQLFPKNICFFVVIWVEGDDFDEDVCQLSWKGICFMLLFDKRLFHASKVTVFLSKHFQIEKLVCIISGIDYNKTITFYAMLWSICLSSIDKKPKKIFLI